MTRLVRVFSLCITFLWLFLLQSTTAFSNRRKALVTRRMSNDNDSAFHHDERLHERQKETNGSVAVSITTPKSCAKNDDANIGQVPPNNDEPEYQEQFAILAKKHYFALRKIKSGNLHHAEYIYRKIIDELSHEEDGHCDHAKLAVTTLLLALLLQTNG